jgi:hypothetical protein
MDFLRLVMLHLESSIFRFQRHVKRLLVVFSFRLSIEGVLGWYDLFSIICLHLIGLLISHLVLMLMAVNCNFRFSYVVTLFRMVFSIWLLSFRFNCWLWLPMGICLLNFLSMLLLMMFDVVERLADHF